MKSVLFALLLGAALPAFAQDNPRVLLNTDRGPLLLELDQQKAPNTVANFLTYVGDGSFDNTLVQRISRNFVIQGGAFKDNLTAITRRATIRSERGNGLSNEYGTIAMALSGNPPNRDSASSDFFINTRAGGNSSLDTDFTVFGRVIFGLKTLQTLNNLPLYDQSETPVRMPVIKKAVRTTGFPILDLHTGAWYDPDNSGRGFSVEVAQAAGGDEAGNSPLLVVYWYDYAEGRQIWTTGAAPFNWGDSAVTLNMNITEGGQFGADFDPTQVTSNPNWGTLTVRFTGCDSAVFSFDSELGQGEWNMQRITLPTRDVCVGQ
ncbi:peptidylprolyl isomerase [Pseudomarimonas arenosa]|uniref:peptidylprolyl isomerase n=1 Tax=Pseudomarimonas arenosa TaxID=2774145 RepID=A0AAW3ZK10_9GAMM|nr:peptidylprolyl isomerase [Pseudomarimonas arenosa]MBD8526336.1 peptidylprolyl isomerase [Pseudomarimonas arenosa]